MNSWISKRVKKIRKENWRQNLGFCSVLQQLATQIQLFLQKYFIYLNFLQMGEKDEIISKYNFPRNRAKQSFALPREKETVLITKLPKNI
jgi:hypothetical protein